MDAILFKCRKLKWFWQENLTHNRVGAFTKRRKIKAKTSKIEVENKD
jgi:hypothetical protein